METLGSEEMSTEKGKKKKTKKIYDKALPFLQFTKLSETALPLIPQPLKTKIF